MTDPQNNWLTRYGWVWLSDRWRFTYPVFSGDIVTLPERLCGERMVWEVHVDGVTLDRSSPGPHEVQAAGDLHLEFRGAIRDDGSIGDAWDYDIETPWIDDTGPQSKKVGGRATRQELVSSPPRLLEQVVLPVEKHDPAWLRQWPTAVSVGGGAFTITLPAGAVPPRALGWLITDPKLWSSGKVPDPANVGSGGPARMGRGFAARWWE